MLESTREYGPAGSNRSTRIRACWKLDINKDGTGLLREEDEKDSAGIDEEIDEDSNACGEECGERMPFSKGKQYLRCWG